MKFGYAIIYVPDILKTLEFYEAAFGFKRKFVHENNYGELDTGAATIAFAAEHMREINGVETADIRPDNKAPGIEIAFVTEKIDEAYQKAVKAGAKAVIEPTKKPWGQTVAYVRDLNGVLIEICTPVSG